MKAEHRHELKTNVLADSMGRLVQNFRGGPRRNSTIIWLLGILAVATAGAWYLSTGNAGWSGLWMKLDSESRVQELDDIIKAGPGTLPARTARFQKARMGMQRLRYLYATDPTMRMAGILSVEEARQLYTDLLPDCTGDPILTQEALLGAAKAEEALAGVPKEEDPKLSRGDLARAQQLYRRLAKEYPDTFQGQAAAHRAEELETNRAEVVKFYEDMRGKLAETQKKPQLDLGALPPMNPPPSPTPSP